MGDLNELKRIIEDAENIVFFGGAGVSTDSGIPDFRGNGGIYTDTDEFDDPPQVILTTSYLHHQPKSFYRYYRSKMIYPYAEPNDAHYALARLEQSGKLSAVITQNIDGLHQAAGSTNVIELHGSIYRNHCVKCGRPYGLDHVLSCDSVPLCDDCGSLVRPDIVLFGEGLNNRDFARAEEAVNRADVLIVAGTSLTVHPAASLVESFEGEHLIIINRSSTPYDDFAELVLRDSVSEVLSEAID